MQYIDVTLPLDETTLIYPGDPALESAAWSSVEESGFQVQALRLGTHTGTHVDAPAHCLPGGVGVDAWPLEQLCGDAYVLDAGSDPAAAGHLLRSAGSADGRIPERLLLRTRDGQPWQAGEPADGPGLDVPAAQALVDAGVRLVGIDRLSIASGDQTLPVHRLLLAAGVAIVEGLELQRAGEGWYELLCLPLRLTGADGAPARVLLTRP